jgi:hypothetical protein
MKLNIQHNVTLRLSIINEHYPKNNKLKHFFHAFEKHLISNFMFEIQQTLVLRSRV